MFVEQIAVGIREKKGQVYLEILCGVDVKTELILEDHTFSSESNLRYCMFDVKTSVAKVISNRRNLPTREVYHSGVRRKYVEVDGDFFQERSLVFGVLSFAVVKHDDDRYLYFDGRKYSFAEKKICSKFKKSLLINKFEIWCGEKKIVSFAYFWPIFREFFEDSMCEDHYAHPLSYASDMINKKGDRFI